MLRELSQCNNSLVSLLAVFGDSKSNTLTSAQQYLLKQ
ncbi:hypothetical Protein YC6258_00307 [Gynuella sunshinyii YC6258]|uniref:Uncharacterized protein n=1 Tax=Gynuella sunshinyii YC6258 TaxID=1445510 RepID=A0A0C5VCY0_9GAMM|nr:hypothetical Protein YC6258_00307 [Gynuella sunshinyii YC6258]